MAYINYIGLAIAPYSHKQLDIFSFIAQQMNVPTEHLDKVKRMYEQSEIETRYSAIQDFSLPKEEWTLFNSSTQASTEARMHTYFDIAPTMCLQAIDDCISKENLKDITHLITVSCTGIAAPGLDIMLMDKINLSPDIQRSSINFMGCYAMLHALKQANDICLAHADAQVMVVGVELCTLHFQSDFNMENVASSLLFADGAAAVLVSNVKGIFEMNDFYSRVLLNGQSDMAWHIGATGFNMNLSAYIPNLIADNMNALLDSFFSKMKINQSEIDHWAIHPGGKKILNELSKALGLKADDLKHAREILSDYGNMSSVTILFLLKKISQEIEPNKKVFAAAFGPGLTIETALLTSC